MAKLTKVYKLPIAGQGQVVGENSYAWVKGDSENPIRPANHIFEFLSEVKEINFSPVACRTILYDFKEGCCVVEITAEEEIHSRYRSWLAQKSTPKEEILIHNERNLPYDYFILCTPALETETLREYITEERLKEIRARVN